VIVCFSRHGEQLIEDILPGHVEAIAAEMSALSLAEQKKLGELCRKLGKKTRKDSNLGVVCFFV